MTQPSNDLTTLQYVIEKRSRKRKLNINLDNLSYANQFYLENIQETASGLKNRFNMGVLPPHPRQGARSLNPDSGSCSG